MIYQVSYVIQGQKGKGKIEQIDHYPKPGETINLEGRNYRVIEVEDLILPTSNFCYIHVLCEPA